MPPVSSPVRRRNSTTSRPAAVLAAHHRAAGNAPDNVARESRRDRHRVLAEGGEDAPHECRVRVLAVAHASPSSVSTTASAITLSGRPDAWLALRSRANASCSLELLLRHQETLRALDHLPRGERVGERLRLCAHAPAARRASRARRRSPGADPARGTASRGSRRRRPRPRARRARPGRRRSASRSGSAAPRGSSAPPRSRRASASSRRARRDPARSERASATASSPSFASAQTSKPRARAGRAGRAG